MPVVRCYSLENGSSCVIIDEYKLKLYYTDVPCVVRKFLSNPYINVGDQPSYDSILKNKWSVHKENQHLIVYCPDKSYPRYEHIFNSWLHDLGLIEVMESD